jgi:prephenate dehydratase
MFADIYILSSSPDTLQEVQHYLDSQGSSLPFNTAKSKSFALEQIRSVGLKVLGTSVDPESVTEQFLSDKIKSERI